MADELEFEVDSLESRVMMAGDVSMRFSARGDLIVTGDGSSNHVQISSIINNDRFVRAEGAFGTTINGANSVLLEAPQNLRQVRINLRGGSNTLSTSKLVADKFMVKTGSGDDLIKLVSSGSVENGLTVNTGGGSDIISLEFTGSNDRLKVSTGSGDDLVILNNSAGNDKTDVALGSGRDVFFSSKSRYGDDFQIRAGGGIDFVSSVSDRFAGDVSLDGGGDADEILGAYPGAVSDIAGEFTTKRFEIVTQPPNMVTFTGVLTSRVTQFDRYDDLIALP